MFLQEDLLRIKIAPYLCAVIFLLSVLLIIVTSVDYDNDHCIDVSIVYSDGTVENIHCDHCYEGRYFLQFDYDRKIMLDDIREYSYTVVRCNCSWNE